MEGNRADQEERVTLAGLLASAMPYTDLPAFMSELRTKQSVSALALQLLILMSMNTESDGKSGIPEQVI